MQRRGVGLLLMLTILAVLLSGCASALSTRVKLEVDPLPSWKDGAAKRKIVQFVMAVTDRSNPLYVAPAERVATFDNDGTLWPEKPVYPQVVFTLDRLRDKARADPSLRETQPYKALLEGDRAYIATLDLHELIEALMTILTGQTPGEFQAEVTAWFAAVEHPRYHRPYTGLVYQPMLELLNYLRANKFQTWICTGGEMDFVRAFAEDVYGVPPEREYDYHKGAEKALRVAAERGWTVVSIKDDFRRVFSSETK